MSILKEFHGGELSPLEEIIPPEMEYPLLLKRSGDGSILRNSFPKTTESVAKNGTSRLPTMEKGLGMQTFLMGSDWA